jgi:hypothetical protein
MSVNDGIRIGVPTARPNEPIGVIRFVDGPPARVVTIDIDALLSELDGLTLLGSDTFSMTSDKLKRLAAIHIELARFQLLQMRGDL